MNFESAAIALVFGATRLTSRSATTEERSKCYSQNAHNGTLCRSTPSQWSSCKLAATEQRNGQRGPAFQLVATVHLAVALYAVRRKLVVKSMANEQDRPIGYKRPPVATQFKPGVSGNPSGRPKSVRSLQVELLEELAEIIRVREGDNEVEISKARAIVKVVANAAVGGNMRAVSLLLPYCGRIAGDTNELQSQVAVPEDTEILNNYLDRELRRRTNADDVNADTQTDSPDQE